MRKKKKPADIVEFVRFIKPQKGNEKAKKFF